MTTAFRAIAFRALAALAVGVTLALPSGARAQSVEEVRLAVQAHNPEFISADEEGGANIGAEVLTASPAWLDWAFSPRPTAGVSINTRGDTSAAFAGLTWDVDIAGPVFVSLFLGGGVHNGERDSNEPDKRNLGCRALFRESLEIGWRLGNGDAVALALDHMSNAGLCDENDGVENLGLKYHLKF
ncbi:MAG: acyloxyacyl hydrolase [Acetobacterales bacterium]